MRSPLSQEAMQASRERLIKIATDLCIAEGEQAISLRRLAAMAGMSRSTPYSYFQDRSEIVDAVRAAALDRLTAGCQQLLETREGPLEQMHALGSALVQFACVEPEIYRLLFSRPVFTGTLSPVMDVAVERFREVSRPPLATALRQGLVQGEEETLRRTTWAAFHGLISLHLQGLLDKAQLQSDFQSLNEILGQGILTPAARST